MSFQDDMDADRLAVFQDTTNGFAVSVTYTTTGGTATTITVIRTWPQGTSEIGLFSPMGGNDGALYHVSAADVTAPALGDRITDGNDTWQAVNVQPVDGFFEVRCARKKDRQ